MISTQKYALACAAVGLLWLSGCASKGDPLPEIAPSVNNTLDDGLLALVSGDELSIQIALLPEWNHKVIVDNEGRANFLGIPMPLQVAGRSVQELRATLENEYRKFLSNPKLGVFVLKYGLREVVVMGEVQKPGAVSIEGGRLTLLQAIGKAGGHRKDSARLSHLILVRWTQDQGKVSQRAWKIDARPSHWPIAGAIYMQPYDFVYIPNTPIDKANIWVEKYIKRMIPIPVPGGLIP